MIELIGLKEDDPKIGHFLNSLDQSSPQCEKKAFNDVTFVNYLKLGLAIEVSNESKRIEAITCYANKNSTKQFTSEFTGSLPFDLRMDMDNRQIVTKFGEPDKKGGGSIPIWISYESEKSGRSIPARNSRGQLIKVQIDFLHKEWECVPNPVAHYTFFA